MIDQDRVKPALAELQAVLGDRATDGMPHRMAYSRDWSPRSRDMADLPDIVVVPRDTDEVVQIVQVALNLCANARDAMSGAGKKELTVTTGSDGAMVFLSVADTGCGIPEEDLAQVFSPFFTRKGEHASDQTQAANKGTGLGLSVCHTIVTNHGGDIHAESTVGSGTTLTVRLPVAAGGEEEAGDVS